MTIGRDGRSMTSRTIDPTPYSIHLSPVPKISRSTALLRTAALSFVIAVVLFGVLTLQMLSGRDPALSANATSPKSGSTSSIGSAGEDSIGSAGEEDDETVVPAAPAPVVTQQVAPAPTPVQTSTS